MGAGRGKGKVEGRVQGKEGDSKVAAGLRSRKGDSKVRSKPPPGIRTPEYFPLSPRMPLLLCLSAAIMAVCLLMLSAWAR